MSYIENFIYRSMEWHYAQIKSKGLDRPKYIKQILTEEVERGLLRATLEFANYDLKQVGEMVGMSIALLKQKIKCYGIGSHKCK